MNEQTQTNGGPVEVMIELRAVDPHASPLPKRQRAPRRLPPHAPVPRKDEVIYLTSTSAWAVRLVVHEWISPIELHILVWVVHIGATHHGARQDFATTQ